MRGIVGSELKTVQKVESASHQLSGLLREMQDKRRLELGVGNSLVNLAKLAKHKLDSRLPRAMQVLTRLKNALT